MRLWNIHRWSDIGRVLFQRVLFHDLQFFLVYHVLLFPPFFICLLHIQIYLDASGYQQQ